MKKIVLLMVTLAVMLTMTGCGGRWYPMKVHDIPPNGKLVIPLRLERDYKLGVKKTVYIGQEIFKIKSYGDGGIITDVVFPQDLTVKSRYIFSQYKIDGKKDTRIKIIQLVKFDKETWSTESGDPYYLIPLKGNDDTQWGLLLSADNVLLPIGIYNYNYHMICVSKETLITPVNFKFEATTEAPAGSYELIFSGKNDVSINATYREYTPDNYAKPAFYQNLTYQADAKQIRFKEFVIQIDEISNEKITYSIVEDGTNRLLKNNWSKPLISLELAH